MKNNRAMRDSGSLMMRTTTYMRDGVLHSRRKRRCDAKAGHAPHTARSWHTQACGPYIDGTISIVLVST